MQTHDNPSRSNSPDETEANVRMARTMRRNRLAPHIKRAKADVREAQERLRRSDTALHRSQLVSARATLADLTEEYERP